LAEVHDVYADDITAMESNSDLQRLNGKLQACFTSIVEWADRKKLNIGPGKSQATLFSPWNKQYNVRPEVSINGVDVPLNKNPEILGIMFDPLFTFHAQVMDIYARACQCLNILGAVSGSSWGHHKETLLLTYQALVESVLNYACAVWYPNAKSTNIQKLQFVQNAAMRLITGCHKASSIS
jgi:hypothetical protein